MGPQPQTLKAISSETSNNLSPSPSRDPFEFTECRVSGLGQLPSLKSPNPHQRLKALQQKLGPGGGPCFLFSGLGFPYNPLKTKKGALLIPGTPGSGQALLHPGSSSHSAGAEGTSAVAQGMKTRIPIRL